MQSPCAHCVYTGASQIVGVSCARIGKPARDSVVITTASNISVAKICDDGGTAICTHSWAVSPGHSNRLTTPAVYGAADDRFFVVRNDDTLLSWGCGDSTLSRSLTEVRLPASVYRGGSSPNSFVPQARKNIVGVFGHPGLRAFAGTSAVLVATAGGALLLYCGGCSRSASLRLCAERDTCMNVERASTCNGGRPTDFSIEHVRLVALPSIATFRDGSLTTERGKQNGRGPGNVLAMVFVRKVESSPNSLGRTILHELRVYRLQPDAAHVERRIDLCAVHLLRRITANGNLAVVLSASCHQETRVLSVLWSKQVGSWYLWISAIVHCSD